MKIVKQFDDFEYFDYVYEGYGIRGFWRWGLGEDGDLYCQSSDFQDPREWNSWSSVNMPLSLKHMKRLVKEFGDLLVFL